MERRFVATVFRLCGLDREVRCAPGDDLVEQKPDVVEQGRLVALDGEHIVGAPGEEILGEGALGVQRIGGDGQAGDIGQRLEQGNDGADLVCTRPPPKEPPTLRCLHLRVGAGVSERGEDVQPGGYLIVRMEKSTKHKSNLRQSPSIKTSTAHAPRIPCFPSGL